MRQAGFCGDAAPRSAARLAALLARVVGGLLRVVTGPGSACGLSAGLGACGGRAAARTILGLGFFRCPSRSPRATEAGLARRNNPQTGRRAMTPYSEAASHNAK